MNHLNYQFEAKPGDVAEVMLDREANVLLMDPTNYSEYQQHRGYRYYGGRATKSPIRLAVPSPGVWHVVVDLGGSAGQVRASTRLIGKGLRRRRR